MKIQRQTHGLVLLACLALFSVNAHALTLKIATAAPDGTVWMDKMREAADKIEKRTSGRLKFKFYPGGVMGSDKSVLRKIRIHQLHGGAVTAGSLAEIYPDVQIYSLPMLVANREELDLVRAKFDAELMSGLEKNGFVGFGFADGGFAYFMSQSPVDSVSSLREGRVWLPEGDVLGKTWFEKAGVAPVTLPLTDVLTGLQTGLINAVASSAIGSIAFQWHTKVTHVTDIPLLYVYATLVIDADTFKKIKADDQKIVREEMGTAYRELDAINKKDDEAALAALKEQRITFVEPSDLGRKELQDSAREAREALKTSGAVSAEMLQNIEAVLQEHRSGK